MRRSALRDFFTRVLPVSLPLAMGACCPDETVSYHIVFDGGLPDGASTDAGCAQICYDNIQAPGGLVLRACSTTVNPEDAGVVICGVKRFECGGRAPERVRTAMRSIATDEFEHAELGWDIDEWTRSVLSASETQRVHSARVTAARCLVAEADKAVSMEMRSELGIPSRHEAIRLANAAFSELWS